MTIGTTIAITNVLAETVGKLAQRHPETGVTISYDTDRAEQLWEVFFHDSPDGELYGYIVNDETGEVTEI